MRRPLPSRPRFRLVIVLGAALLVGCAAPRPVPPPPPDAPPGYIELRETFGPLDFAPLAGRRIVLDPGHGGFFRGAIGPNDLAEADVNLGVALHLRGLLEWAGAEVFMTRTADYDFLEPADSTLVRDLAFRVSFSADKKPDVFLSIHHNSTATADPEVNETQTYYPLGDDGASLDLARAIHRHLVINLEIAPAQILPGNFHVLRHATVPAVLGEPAMISHPVMAGRLSLAASQKLEAEAYFLGLLDYFAGGSPRWQAAHGDTVVARGGQTTLAWTFADDRAGSGAPGPDPATYDLRVDGAPASLALDATGTTVRWTVPPSLGGGAHRIALSGRNLAGRRTPTAVTVLLPDTARAVQVEIVSESDDLPGRRCHLRCMTADGRPLPRGGVGWPDVPGATGVLPTAGRAEVAGVVTRGVGAPVYIGAHPEVDLDVREEELPGGFRLRKISGGGSWQDRLGAGGGPVRRLAGAVVQRQGAPAWLEAAGWIPLIPDTGAATASTDLEPSRVVPALAGLIVVIDPAGGGIATDGSGPLGLTGADLNFEVSLRLARLLEGCGARAVLTRSATAGPSAVDRVALAGDTGADLFLTVGRATDPTLVTVRHHPGSVDGSTWATGAAAAVSRLLPHIRVEVAESWSYRLRHTSCPALEVRLPGPTTAAAELRLQTTAWQAAEARALLLGMLGRTPEAADATQPARSPAPTVVDPFALLATWPDAPVAAAVTRVVWDGNLPLYPLPARHGTPGEDPVSSWQEPGVPAAGPHHTLEVHTAERWQLWRVDRDAVGRWRGRLAWAGLQDTATDE